MITFQGLLVAGILDVLVTLGGIALFLVWVFNQLLSAKGNQQQQQRNQQRRPPQRAERPMRPAQPQAGQPQGGQAQGGQAQLNAEIEQFLKRAGQRRGERPQPDRATRAPAPPPAPKPPRKAPTTARPQAMREQPVEAMALETGRLSTVGESVQQHLGRGKFADRAEHLADEVTHADEDMQAHLQQVFGHQVGTLGRGLSGATSAAADAPTKTVEAAPARAASLAQLLRTGQGMKQAIVLSEILACPEHRW